jgi:hypothetical protein
MYFKKLDIPFDFPSFEIGDCDVSFGIQQDGKFRGIWYNSITSENENQFKNCIPEEFRDSFIVQLMQVNSIILPHTDSESRTVINFYFETDDCITQFYEIKENAKPIKIENQTNGSIYSLKDLEEGPAFLAEPGDVYLLNVSKAHSVIPATDGIVNRSALCLTTASLDFTDVEEFFIDKDIDDGNT